MSASEVEKIALYLNLAYSKLYAAAGKFTFLTGKDSPSIAVNGGPQNQETQVMAVGSAIWIANNDDGISTTLQSFCETLQIKSVKRLTDHVEAHATRALDYNRVTAAPEMGDQASMHSKVLVRLIAQEKDIKPEEVRAATALDTARISPSNGAGLSKYTLGTGSPKDTGIVFVHGTYESNDVHGSQHAEQKLLAALGELGTLGLSTMYVAGCKAPCAVCGRVLDAVKLQVPRLRYTNPQMASIRADAGLGAYNPNNIRRLDVNHYF